MTTVQTVLNPYEDDVVDTHCKAYDLTKNLAIKNIIHLYGDDHYQDMLNIIKERSTERE